MKKYFLKLAHRLKYWLERKLRTEDEKKFYALRKQQHERQKASQKLGHDLCLHIAGSSSLSEYLDYAKRTSIVWHRTDVGSDVGICLICQRIFLPHDPDYKEWRKKPSFCKPSGAGWRGFVDPQRAYETVFGKPGEEVLPAPGLPGEGESFGGWKIKPPSGIDPWLLDSSGNRDPFTNVDFLSVEDQPKEESK